MYLNLVMYLKYVWDIIDIEWFSFLKFYLFILKYIMLCIFVKLCVLLNDMYLLFYRFDINLVVRMIF